MKFTRSIAQNRQFVLGVVIGFLLGYLSGTLYGSTSGASEPNFKLLTKQGEAVNKKVKLALLLDTSGSMDGLLNQAKSQLWSLVNELIGATCEGEEVDLEIALYEYGKSTLPASEQYIRMVTPLTDDLDQLSKDLFSLRTNGGDEFCGAVIKRSLSQLDWSNRADDLQMIFIAGNEPFTQGNVNYVKVCQEAAEKGIVINTIFCGIHEEGVRTQWKHGADITGGSYMSIDHNRVTEEIDTPYDDDIVRLNKRLNTTYLQYGETGNVARLNQVEQDRNAEAINKKVLIKRSISKAGSNYSKGASKWDLTSKYKSDQFSDEEIEKELEDLDEATLPPTMQNKTKAEKLMIVKQKQKERDTIKYKLLDLRNKRATYLIKNSSETEGELENAMSKALRSQASKKLINIK